MEKPIVEKYRYEIHCYHNIDGEYDDKRQHNHIETYQGFSMREAIDHVLTQIVTGNEIVSIKDITMTPNDEKQHRDRYMYTRR